VLVVCHELRALLDDLAQQRVPEHPLDRHHHCARRAGASAARRARARTLRTTGAVRRAPWRACNSPVPAAHRASGASTPARPSQGREAARAAAAGRSRAQVPPRTPVCPWARAAAPDLFILSLTTMPVNFCLHAAAVAWKPAAQPGGAASGEGAAAKAPAPAPGTLQGLCDAPGSADPRKAADSRPGRSPPAPAPGPCRKKDAIASVSSLSPPRRETRSTF